MCALQEEKETAVGSPGPLSSPSAAAATPALASAGAPAGDAKPSGMPERSYLDVIQARFDAGGGRESLTRLLYVATIPKTVSKQQVWGTPCVHARSPFGGGGVCVCVCVCVCVHATPGPDHFCVVCVFAPVPVGSW
jgi:hypothetical protein